MSRTRKLLEPERWAPPGFDLKAHRILFGIFTGAAIIWPIMSFGSRLSDALRDFERYNTPQFADFYELLGNALLVIPIALAVMCALAGMHYSYHRAGSRSIYLMRRLPKRWELHRRCLGLPLAGIVWFILLAAAMLFAMYGIYMLAAPEGSVAPDQFEKLIKLWRVI